MGNSNSGGDNSGSGQAGPEMSGDKTNDNGKATDEDAAQQDKGVRSTSEKPNGSLPQSVTENTRQGRDLDGHKRKGKGNVTEHSDSESSDQGLCFDDIISPGGEHLNFGTFQNMEIKNLWSVKLSENVSAVINEYGSNLFKSKFDPLAAIEAKNALAQGTFPLEFSPFKINNTLETIQEEKIEVQEKSIVENISTPSPYLGTQEATLAESSQEHLDLGLESQPTLDEGDTDHPIGGDLLEEDITPAVLGSQPQDGNDGDNADPKTVPTDLGSLYLNDLAIEEVINTSMEETQTAEKTTPMQSNIRQSDRLKQQSLGCMKIADRAEALMKKKESRR